jgi:hypothetical protein
MFLFLEADPYLQTMLVNPSQKAWSHTAPVPISLVLPISAAIANEEATSNPFDLQN